MRLTRICPVALAVLVLGSVRPHGGAPPSPHVSTADPLTPDEEQKSFHLPPGFEIELVAAEPEIRKPINMNFDARGRLWVTQSTEYPFAAGKDRKPQDRVQVIEWAKPEGKADKVTDFRRRPEHSHRRPAAERTGPSSTASPNIYRLD